MRRQPVRVACLRPAALRQRRRAAVQRFWRLVDGFLRSRRAAVIAVAIPVGVATACVLYKEGTYGLVTNAENLATIGGLPYLAITAARRYRRVRPSRADSRSTPRSRPRSSRQPRSPSRTDSREKINKETLSVARRPSRHRETAIPLSRSQRSAGNIPLPVNVPVPKRKQRRRRSSNRRSHLQPR